MPRPRRLAYLHGNNAYPGASALSGCVNDAELWSRTLSEKRKYRGLIFPDADKQTLLHNLEESVRYANEGNLVVWFYSGHGTQVRDYDREEGDGWDEAIVPIDFQKSGFITDDQIRYYLTQLKPGIGFTVIMDCCFSGTITRLFSANAHPAPLGAKARFMRWDRDLQILHQETDTQRNVAARIPAEQMRWVQIAACQPTEVSYEQELDGVSYGDFTRIATQTVLKSGDSMSHKGLINRILREWGEERWQTPMVDCAPGNQYRTLVTVPKVT